MLSIFRIILFLFLLFDLNSFTVSSEGQLLDCTNLTESSELSSSSSCVSKSTAKQNSSEFQRIKTTSNEDLNQPQLKGARDRHRRQSNQNKTSFSDVCSNGNVVSDWKPSMVCLPRELSNVTTSDRLHKENRTIEVYIRTPSNVTQFEPGSSLVIECKFNTSLKDFKFELKWLRSVLGSHGTNQSITNTRSDSLSTIVAAATRVWTVQRDGGLDLELKDFQEIDAGNYFCQAVSSRSEPESILSEAVVQLNILKQPVQLTPSISTQLLDDFETTTGDLTITGNLSSILSSFNFYTQDNLSKLLPSLKVIPKFSEIAKGDMIQLVCITSELDPDPDPAEIKWTFESIEHRSQLMIKPPAVLSRLPYNVSVLGNVLIVWSMSEEHCGIYRCTVEMPEFNLSVQAIGELALRPQIDSAPLVFISPELVRLSPNGSATIQCEATGYPPPDVTWYRVDSSQQLQQQQPNDEDILHVTDDSAQVSVISLKKSFNIDGIELEQIHYKDSMVFCEQKKCISSSHLTNRLRTLATGISLIHIKQAKALHQGQYVCQASNKHGSNQASSVIDVEFKEPPQVKIASQFREQTVLLPAENLSEHHNVTFKCSIESGRPQPRIRWLRTSNRSNLKADNLDIYDLTKVSSATSNVSTWPEDNGKTLVLVVSTISLDDEGDYICLGENEWGRHSAVAHLVVRKPISVKILQPSPLIARINDSFHLDCLTSGHPIPLDIEWSRSDQGVFFSLITRTSNMNGSHERASLKFDRVNADESGEYTCNARDPLNPSHILRDTIMVLVEDHSKWTDLEGSSSLAANRAQNSLLPKLMVRPTKLNAPLGTNITLDCLAVSGLQPTVVEWIAPPSIMETAQMDKNNNNNISIINNNSLASTAYVRPYYRDGPTNGHLFQFGSKLKILNVSKEHEGVYQCKGKNKIGIENAPALVKVLDSNSLNFAVIDSRGTKLNANQTNSLNSSETKTKIAKIGSNIELKCQVNGIEQPATSWSREGLELPTSSVQIEHNLWIQNVTARDNGLYICSARSKQPNKVIQAKINLLVRGNDLDLYKKLHNLSAKIVASKSTVNLGDSITLECIISLNNVSADSTVLSSSIGDEPPNSIKPVDLVDEVERNVIWTNLHSGQSLFQDNVYIQNNLLIIYELKSENSATYRCNYNDLSQQTDYKLQVIDTNSTTNNDWPTNVELTSPRLINNHMIHSEAANALRAQLKQISLGSQLIVECPFVRSPGVQFSSSDLNTTTTTKKFNNYHWTRGSQAENNKPRAVGQENSPLVFESIGTDQADIYNCHRSGSNDEPQSVLVHVLVPVARFAQKPVSFITLPTISGANHQLDLELKFLPERESGLILFNGQHPSNRSVVGGDYISLGLNRGFLEFRFELGDGTTLLKSSQILSLNQWHKVAIERNRRGAVMWLDKQPPVSNSSVGKFFNLNLDSVLYVGGNQYFLNKSRAGGGQGGRFYGYSRGFQGCISLLRISGSEINLMPRGNRTVAIGIYECDKPECRPNDCNQQNGVCQIDRNWLSENERKKIDSTKRVSNVTEFRCICLPGFGGDRCDKTISLMSTTESTIVAKYSTPHSAATISVHTSSSPAPTPAPAPTTTTVTSRSAKGACDLLNPCSVDGTLKCQSLTSTSFKCHCQLGFMGDICAQVVLFLNETSVWFNQQAYLQFKFNTPEEAQLYLRQQHAADTKTSQNSNFNLTNFTKSISMAEHQNISFKLQTKSSYGLIFYTGQAFLLETNGTSADSMSIAQSQTSKSMVANLLARLSNIVFDYLAIALVDGHVELSYELGSGVAIIRSSQRINDGEEHQVRVLRNGKLARLIIDDLHKHEGSSPGKLSMLNSQADIYLGGLPHLAELTNNMYMSGFVGCLSNLEINSLGPLNLIRSDHLSQVRSARNLMPCPSSPVHQEVRHKPYQSPPATGENDDPDEM